jgi:hypothetical protein
VEKGKGNMKLSDAMMLGSVTVKMEAGDWNSCALGAAANAVGIPKEVPPIKCPLMGCVVEIHGVNRAEAIYGRWPWLQEITDYVPQTDFDSEEDFMDQIYGFFDDHVCEGKMTFEQLVDYVRSVEPACGVCNEFECSCVPVEVESTEKEVAV